MNASTLVINRLKSEVVAVSGVWFMHSPVGTELPFITVIPFSDIADNTLDGEDNLHNELLQIDIWASTFSQAYAIEAAIKESIKTSEFTAIRQESNADFDKTSDYPRVMLTYSIWYEA